MAQNDGQVETPVWFTPFPADPANYGQMDFIEPEGSEGMARPLSNRGVRFPPEHMPLCFRDMSGRYGADFKRFMPDFFMSRHVVLTVSQKMHDVLVQFDLGDNQLTELPFVAHDRVTPRPERFWLLAVAEKKSGLDVEASAVGPTVVYENGTARLLPNTLTLHPTTNDYMYNSIMEAQGGGKIALSSSVLDGADLWRDPLIGPELLFVSDRLRQAIKAAKIKARNMPFFPVTLVP
ncbi:imm11 family protein [Jannaschia helgolandensis]|uniref:imm11 family protein n=1 Tax=Jannaschia helgolandensis TaxID=188906 RepID=UPI0030DB00D9